jgi:hypothetical protein
LAIALVVSMTMSKSAVAAVFLLISGARAERHSLNLETLEVEQAAGRGPHEDCNDKCPGSHASKTSKVFGVGGPFGRDPVECACDDPDMVLGNRVDGRKPVSTWAHGNRFDFREANWDNMCMFEEERPFRKALAETDAVLKDAEYDQKHGRGVNPVYHIFKVLGEAGEALRYVAGAFKKEEVKAKTVNSIYDTIKSEGYDCDTLGIMKLVDACKAAVVAISLSKS